MPPPKATARGGVDRIVRVGSFSIRVAAELIEAEKLGRVIPRCKAVVAADN